jgi:hypothetical protein
MSTISASTLTTTALVYTADTTGALVFKTGATPTTALTLGADQSATFAGTVNFGTAGFTNLSVTGVATFSAGTVSLPSITTAGDTNTGIYFPAADTIGFTEGGVEALRLNSNGQTATSIAGTASLPSFTRTGDENTGIFFPAADTIAFSEGGTEVMRISSAGNVGIGTNNPVLGLLDINGVSSTLTVRTPDTTSPTLALFVNAGSNGVGTISVDNGGIMTFDTGSTGAGQAERMRITAAGDVLIGTTTALIGSRLVVKSSNNSLASFIGADAAGTSYFVQTNGSGQINHYATYATSGVNCYHAWWTTTSGGSQTQAMTLDVSGNLGIGTTSPNAAFRLDVVGNAGIRIQGGTTGKIDLRSASGNAVFIGMTEAGVADRGVIGFPAGDSAMIFRANGAYDFSTGTAVMRISATGFLQFNSGYGSVETAYGVRAWVNFNGTGTISVRASGNVSSIGDNGTGDYTMNFGTAMPDANYAVSGTCMYPAATNQHFIALGDNNGAGGTNPTASSFRFQTIYRAAGAQDCTWVEVSVVR